MRVEGWGGGRVRGEATCAHPAGESGWSVLLAISRSWPAISTPFPNAPRPAPNKDEILPPSERPLNSALELEISALFSDGAVVGAVMASIDSRTAVEKGLSFAATLYGVPTEIEPEIELCPSRRSRTAGGEAGSPGTAPSVSSSSSTAPSWASAAVPSAVLGTALRCKPPLVAAVAACWRRKSFLTEGTWPTRHSVIDTASTVAASARAVVGTTTARALDTSSFGVLPMSTAPNSRGASVTQRRGTSAFASNSS